MWNFIVDTVFPIAMCGCVIWGGLTLSELERRRPKKGHRRNYERFR